MAAFNGNEQANPLPRTARDVIREAIRIEQAILTAETVETEVALCHAKEPLMARLGALCRAGDPEMSEIVNESLEVDDVLSLREIAELAGPLAVGNPEGYRERVKQLLTHDDTIVREQTGNSLDGMFGSSGLTSDFMFSLPWRQVVARQDSDGNQSWAFSCVLPHDDPPEWWEQRTDY